jgi:hypothetical protein
MPLGITFLSYQNEFSDAFPDSLVPNKSAVSRLVKFYLSDSSPHSIEHEEKSECVQG